MGFDFEAEDTSDYSLADLGLTVMYREFSEHCDALLHGHTAEELGFTKIPDEFRVLEQKGCFVPDFYMVNPFYYIGIEKFPIMFKGGIYVGSVKDGAIFIIMPEDDVDLEDLKVEFAKEYDPDVIESLPVVLFRRCRKPIDISGKTTSLMTSLKSFIVKMTLLNSSVCSRLSVKENLEVTIFTR